MVKKKIKIILKSGYEITVLCDNYVIKYNKNDSSIIGYEFYGIDKEHDCSIVHIDLNEIAAIIQTQ